MCSILFRTFVTLCVKLQIKSFWITEVLVISSGVSSPPLVSPMKCFIASRSLKLWSMCWN